MEVFSILLSSLLLLDSDGLTTNLFFASLYNIPLLYFLTIIFGALFIGNDFGERTLYSYISAGHKRSYVLFVKAFTYQIACMAFLALPLLLHGFVGILCLEKTTISVGEFLITGVTILTAISAMCMLPFFFAVIFRDIGRTLAVPMVVFFLMIFLMNGDHAKQIGAILPMGQLRLISLQQSSISVMVIIAIDILWICILYLGAYLLFCRSDLR
jgi:hypothetical protein